MTSPQHHTTFEFQVTPQPTELTCGPSSLHAVYRYHGLDLDLHDLIEDVANLPDGGTLAVMLGIDALRRGFDVTIYTFDLHLFDPSWFAPGGRAIREGLARRALLRSDEKVRIAARAFIDFLDAGGTIEMVDLSAALMHKYLDRKVPIIAGLSATWLYRCAREVVDPENPEKLKPDDLGGESTGHFVVIHGLDPNSGRARVADPYLHNPYPGEHHYGVDLDRLISAILIGIVTYDAQLLIITPRESRASDTDADPPGRQ